MYVKREGIEYLPAKTTLKTSFMVLLRYGANVSIGLLHTLVINSCIMSYFF